MGKIVKINKQLSEKLRIMSFVAILMVVFNHGYCVDATLNKGITLNIIMQKIILTGNHWIAVPTFFFMSGYLFFLNFKGTYCAFKTKFRKRFKSLFLPYLYWCGGGYLLIFLMQLLPISHDFYSKCFYQMSFSENLWNIFYEPVNYPLWFIRDLMVFIIFTPILYHIIKRVPFLFLLFVFGISFVKVSLIRVWDVNILGFASFSFFVGGSIVALRRIQLIYELKFYFWLPLFLTWLVLIILRIIGGMNGYSEITLTIIDRLGSVFGFFVCWLGFDLIPSVIKEWKNNIYSYTFIIYVLHGIPLVMFSRMFFSLVRRTPNTELIAFIILPLLTIIFSVQLGKLINTLAPSFYRLITGGR